MAVTTARKRLFEGVVAAPVPEQRHHCEAAVGELAVRRIERCQHLLTVRILKFTVQGRALCRHCQFEEQVRSVFFFNVVVVNECQRVEFVGGYVSE